MLETKTDKLLYPKINLFESNEPNYSPDIYQIIEQESDFDKIINIMKANSKPKVSLKGCSNAECQFPFTSNLNCVKCVYCDKNYCKECIKQCKICSSFVCPFCTKINYESGNIEVCPNCY